MRPHISPVHSSEGGQSTFRCGERLAASLPKSGRPPPYQANVPGVAFHNAQPRPFETAIISQPRGCSAMAEERRRPVGLTADGNPEISLHANILAHMSNEEASGSLGPCLRFCGVVPLPDLLDFHGAIFTRSPRHWPTQQRIEANPQLNTFAPEKRSLQSRHLVLTCVRPRHSSIITFLTAGFLSPCSPILTRILDFCFSGRPAGMIAIDSDRYGRLDKSVRAMQRIVRACYRLLEAQLRWRMLLVIKYASTATLHFIAYCTASLR